MSLNRQNYMRASVLFDKIQNKEGHSFFLFQNHDSFPEQAMNILNMIDTENGPINIERNGLFVGYVDILAYRRRNHPMFTDYKHQMDNHLMFLFLKQRARTILFSIVTLKLFVRKRVPSFIEWFYDPDKGTFMKNTLSKWRLNNE